MEESKDVILAARGLVQAYELGKKRVVDVLRGLSLEIRRGETVFLTGPSGAGKTTLLYCLAGLERPKAGEVLLEGENLYALKSARLA